MRPAGIQLEDITPGHQHIDLVYFAIAEPDGVAISETARRTTRAGWYALEELPALGVNEEICAWAARALEAARAWQAQPPASE